MSSVLHYVHPSLVGGLLVSLGGYILCAHVYQIQGQMLGQSILSTHHLVEKEKEERTNGIPLVYQL